MSEEVETEIDIKAEADDSGRATGLLFSIAIVNSYWPFYYSVPLSRS